MATLILRNGKLLNGWDSIASLDFVGKKLGKLLSQAESNNGFRVFINGKRERNFNRRINLHDRIEVKHKAK